MYLSSPFLFEHRIEYRPEEPTVTLMCRFGFLDESDALWVNHLRGKDMLDVAELFASELKAFQLRLPSLEQLKKG